jgi:hypothetical protein
MIPEYIELQDLKHHIESCGSAKICVSALGWIIDFSVKTESEVKMMAYLKYSSYGISY